MLTRLTQLVTNRPTILALVLVVVAAPLVLAAPYQSGSTVTTEDRAPSLAREPVNADAGAVGVPTPVDPASSSPTPAWRGLGQSSRTQAADAAQRVKDVDAAGDEGGRDAELGQARGAVEQEAQRQVGRGVVPESRPSEGSRGRALGRSSAPPRRNIVLGVRPGDDRASEGKADDPAARLASPRTDSTEPGDDGDADAKQPTAAKDSDGQIVGNDELSIASKPPRKELPGKGPKAKPSPNQEPAPEPEPKQEPTPEPEPKQEPAPEPAPQPQQEDAGVDADAWLQRLSIGSPQPSGSSTSADGVYRISAAGADIWGNRDSFEFVQREHEGDVSFVARVSSQTNTDPWAKAGLMIRESASPGSRHVSLFQTPANGAALQYRLSSDSSSYHVGAEQSSPPAWLRLDRSGDRFSAYVSDDGVNWKIVGSVAVPMAAVVLVGYAVTSHSDGTRGEAVFHDGSMESEFEPGSEAEPAPSTEPAPPATVDPEPVAPLGVDGRSRLLYSADDIAVFSAAMARPGPYYATGDAGHGGRYSPGDGERSVQLARQFLSNPQASYWIQPNLPFSSGDPWPSNMQYVRPLHAAWVYMTQPDHPDRAALEREVKALLLHHANHPSHDFADASKYPVTYQGFAPRPIFDHAQWMARLIKARDMLGRESFSAAENSVLDRWFYDYSNWAFQWMHQAHYGRRLPGRLSRNYTQINTWAEPQRRTFDGGPLVGSLAMDYSNRQATVASTASYAANYLAHHGFSAPTSGGPTYGRLTVNQLLEHSRLFVEETIRFSVFPEGVQGDFERGDDRFHPSPSPQQGWLYSANVLAGLVDIATYHAARGDMSVWNYGTTQGHQGTAGVPVAGGFREKNLHFYAWSMVRYANDGWNRRNRGQPLVLPQHYRDVLPAAGAARLAPNDSLLRSAWRRDGQGFPAYPERPESQGMWPAHLGEGAGSIGIIEHAGATPFGGR